MFVGVSQTDEDPPHGYSQVFYLKNLNGSYCIGHDIFRLLLHNAWINCVTSVLYDFRCKKNCPHLTHTVLSLPCFCCFLLDKLECLSNQLCSSPHCEPETRIMQIELKKQRTWWIVNNVCWQLWHHRSNLLH